MRHLIPFFSFALIPLLVSAPFNAQVIGNPGVPESSDLQISIIAGYTGSAPVNSQAKGGFTVEVTTLDGAPVADAAVALRLPDTEPTGAFPDESHAMVAYTDQSGHARLTAVKWGSTPGLVAIRVTAVKGTAHAGVLVEEKLLAASVSSPAPEPRSAPAAIVSAVASSAAVSAASIPVAQPVAAQPVAVQPASAQPVALIKPAAIESQVASTPAAGHALTPAVAPLKPAPSVSVTNSASASSQTHSSHKKWIIIAAIAAGAGAGIALAGHGKSGGSTSQTSSLTIGAPTVSVGHP